MSKENNLKDYLTDLYDGISSKKPDASRNPQNFRAEIEAIKTGGIPWDGDYTIEGDALPEPPKAYYATSADELPTDAVDGSLAVVGEEFYIREKGKWVKGAGGIIEVNELPTENIDTNAFYLFNGEYYRYVEGEWKKYSADGGMAVHRSVQPTKDNTNVTNLSNLKLDFTNAKSIDERAFVSCAGLTEIALPSATIIGKAAFAECYALAIVNAPVVTNIGVSAFADCEKIQSIDLPKVTDIATYAFDGCKSLNTIILRNTETVCNLIVNAVLGTKILTAEGMPTGEGFIYVPTKFYEQYVSNLVAQVMQMGYDEATATYLVTAVLRKIEDYPEICG